jgi:hypothetical protein
MRVEFSLHINTKRHTMTGREDVADAIEDVARQLRDVTATQRITGPVRDSNGSTIGTFALFMEATDCATCKNTRVLTSADGSVAVPCPSCYVKDEFTLVGGEG